MCFSYIVFLLLSKKTRRSRSVYLCQHVDKMWKLLILLSSDCIRKTWLLSPVYQVLHQVAEDLDTNKKTRGKPKLVPRFAAGTSNNL